FDVAARGEILLSSGMEARTRHVFDQYIRNTSADARTKIVCCTPAPEQGGLRKAARTMSADWPSPVNGQPSVARRMAGFMALWLIIMGSGLKDLPMGLAASLAASWVSLRL